MEKKIKICLACSVGGHLTQMIQLENLYRKHDYFFVTEDMRLTRELAKKEKVYFLKLINRKKWNFLFLFGYNFILSLQYIVREKPDLIISTGALSAIPSCILARLMGKKLIFIESFAKMETPTLTGRLIYNFADVFIIQWIRLGKFYPNAIYGGSIY